MNTSAVCRNCGAQLSEAARFCPICGLPVSRHDAAFAGEPSNKFLSTGKLPRVIAAAGLSMLLVVLVAFAVFGKLRFESAGTLFESQSASSALLMTPATVFATAAQLGQVQPATTSTPIAINILSLTDTATPTAVLSTPTVSAEIRSMAPLASSMPTMGAEIRSAAPFASSTPTATTPLVIVVETPVPSPTPISAVTATGSVPDYDLYVKSIEYVLNDATNAGQLVHLNFILATDIYPVYGPFFPLTHFRWRPGALQRWQEGLCLASDRFATCYTSADVLYPLTGNYEITVEIDPLGQVSEWNEANNSKSMMLDLPGTSVTPTATPILFPTSTPTLLPTATPTKTPTRKPRASYSAVTFSSGFDDSALVPLNPAKTFPYGVKIIYAYWTYSGVVPDTAFEYSWYRNGTRIDGSGERFINVSGKAFQWLVYGYAPTTPLDAGNYQFVVRVNGQAILSGSFVIQAPQIGGPIAGAISVFFTVENGSPTGWVYDKQGIKHTPQYGTISDLHVQPGDRIVLQTDQARFSLLFDCSTTPGTFSPCDFSADSPANLPQEIRAVQNGMSGFMNISRADNWAGFRPGHEPQRYPADPVLRIVFSW